MALFRIAVCVLVALTSEVLSCSGSCRPRDCQDLREMGFTSTGVYVIFPDKQSGGIQVRCDMTTSGGGWTTIQRRVSSSSFYYNWDTYERGFGSPSGNHWLGNLLIHKITSQDGYQLRVDLNYNNGTFAYALYNHFMLFDVTHNYQLLANGYSGTAGDSLGYHNGRPFSTYDKDNDSHSTNCASTYHGAWWYGSCHRANLNGLYGSSVYGKGLNWLTFSGYHSSPLRVEMKIRRYKGF